MNRPQNAINTARLSAATPSIIHLGQSSTLTQKQCVSEIVPASYRNDCMPRLKTGFMVNDLTESGPHKGIHLRKLTPRDAEWTPDGLLRHVVYLGKRENTPAIEVRRTTPHAGET
jgi:hypothetical protein